MLVAHKGRRGVRDEAAEPALHDEPIPAVAPATLL
jgi:hypothetical protein